ncbi:MULTISPECIES: hypothetical protein [Streptomyces]|jgi:hypothetical protein|uniref:Rv1733c family protein n=1 Tax=Streptomyces TaxID=1883 RepID=UPI00074A39A5|nr:MULTISPECIES: hypothetical protein [Streptomyces]KUL76817.1 hypothetical protein ADL33_11360 [Streptomyces sp. NRRL WC-3604]KUL80119.1 hypothetical protein ADL34_02730 [Streptomyces sp. NRRL WC-3605]
MRAIAGLWRWRHNPLRRRTDVAEGWVALLAMLLIAVAAPTAGSLVGGVAQESLQDSVRQQRASRHQVWATVVRTLDGPRLDLDPETTAGRGVRARVLADWTAADGTARHGAVTVDLNSPEPGTRFPLWTDRQGRVAAPPLDFATASAHAVIAGFGAALLAIALIEAARRLIVWRMVRGRYLSWDRAWDKAGPDWGRTGAGS